MAERDIIFRAKFLQEEAVRAFESYLKTLGVSIVAFNQKLEQISKKSDQTLKQEVTAIKDAEKEKLEAFIARRMFIRRAAAEQIAEVKQGEQRQVDEVKRAEKEKTRITEKEAEERERIAAEETETLKREFIQRRALLRDTGRVNTSQEALGGVRNQIDEFRTRATTALGAGLVDQRATTAAIATLENRYSSLTRRLASFNDKLEQNEQLTKGDIIALRRLDREMEDFGRTVAQVENRLAETNIQVKRGSEQFAQLFKGAVIGGFALQQIGGFLRINVTQPLIELGKYLYQVTTQFDTLQTLLTERAGKSLDEVGESMDTVGKVAKLRNFDLESSVTLYSRLFEATRGAIDDRIFETVAKGISAVSASLEAGEKRAFLGQIQDVLGGGDVANLQRTLSLVPALKSVFDEIKSGAESQGKALSDTDALMKAFERFASLPALQDLQTKIKNVRVDFELLAERLGRVYKDDLARLADILSDRVIPMFARWLDSFERLSPSIQNFTAIVVGLVAALAPLASIIGLVTVAGFGLASMVKSLLGFFAVWTGALEATVASTASLGTLMASVASKGTVLGTILTTAWEGISAAASAVLTVTGAIYAAIAGLIIAVIALDLSGLQSTLYNLGGDVLLLVWNALKAIYDVINGLIDAAVALFKWLYQFTTVQEVLQFIAIILSGILSIVGIIISAVGQLFALISAVVQFFRDWSEMNLEEASARFKLAVLLALKEVIEYLPSFVQAWINIDDKIRIAKEQTKGLGDEQEDAVGKTNKLTNEFKKQTVAIKELTDAIKKQAEERAKIQRGEYDTYLQGQTNQQTAQKDAKIGILEEKLSKFDLANEEQAILAEQTQREINRELLAKKVLEQRLAAMRRIADFSDNTAKQLQEMAFKAGEQQQLAMQSFFQALAANVQGTPDNTKALRKTLEGALVQTQTGEGGFMNIPAVGRQQVIDWLQQQIGILGDEEKSIAEEGKNIYDLQTSNNEKIRKLKDDIAKKQKERQQIIQTDELSVRKQELERKLQNNEAQIEIIKNLYERNKVSLAQAIQQFREKETEQLELSTQISDLELQIFNVQNPNDVNKQLEQKKQNERDNKKRRDDIKERFKKERLDLVNDLLDSSRDTNEQIQQLRDAFQEENAKYIDALIGMAGLGVSDDARFKQAIEDSKQVSASILGSLRTSSKELLDIAELTQENKTFQGVGQQARFKQVPELVNTFLEAFKKINVNTITEKEIDGFLIEGRKLLDFFGNPDFGEGLDEAERAAIQEFIQRYLKFLQDLQAARVDISKKNEDALKRESEYLLAQKEFRLENLRIQRDILDLDKEKLTDNLSVRAGEIKSLKDVGSFIVEALTGSRRQLFEMEKQALENQRAQAALELEIAIQRLQIEQEIYLLKLKEMKASEETINKARESFEKQIELVKQRGALEMEQLDRQIARLTEFSGSIGEVFTQAVVGLFDNLLSKKKDSEDGEEAGAPAVISDEAAEETEKNAKSQLGWLDKLKGGLKTASGFIFAFGDALMKLEKITLGAIIRMIKEELKALGRKMLIKSLEFAAVAIAAAVFGDYGTAAKATKASIAYGAAAAAAYAGAGILGLLDGNGEQKAQNAASANASTTPDNESKIQTLKQQAQSILIRLDIFQDDSTVVKKQIKALNQNTELTNVVVNQQQGWTIPQNP